MARIVKDADVRRKEILMTARRLFETQEYEKVTMQQIMKILDIAKGTIYHYFSSKEELLEGVVEFTVAEQVERQRAIVGSEEFKGLGTIEKFMNLFSAVNIADENEQLLESMHKAGHEKMHARQLGRYITEIAPIVAEVIEEGCESGLFSTSCPLESAELLLAGIQTLTDVGIFPWSQEAVNRRFSVLPELIERQLGAREGTFSFLLGE